jgi:hypothetical protein
VVAPTVNVGVSGAIEIEFNIGGTVETVTTVDVESDPLIAVTVVVPLATPLNKPVEKLIVPTALFVLI